jgi:hypothetical protein
MKINEVLVEGPFDAMKAAPSNLDAEPLDQNRIAMAKKQGIKAGLDKAFGTRAFAKDDAASAAEIEMSILKDLTPEEQQKLLVALQKKLGVKAADSVKPANSVNTL